MKQLLFDLYYSLTNLCKDLRVSLGLRTGKYKRYPIVQIENVAEEVGVFKSDI